MKKKLMVTFILVAMAVSMIPIGAYAANIELYAPSSPNIDGVTKMDASTYTIVAGDVCTLMESYSGALTVPASASLSIPSGVTAGAITTDGTLDVQGTTGAVTHNSGNVNIYSTGSTGTITGASASCNLNNAGANITITGTFGNVTNSGTNMNLTSMSGVSNFTNSGGNATIDSASTINNLNVNGGSVTIDGTANGTTTVAAGATLKSGASAAFNTVSNNGTWNHSGSANPATGSINNYGTLDHGGTLWTGITNGPSATENSHKKCTSCGNMVPNPSSQTDHAANCPLAPCLSCTGTLGAHVAGCPLKPSYKFYYQKKDTTAWVGTDDKDVAMKQGEGTKVKLGQDVTAADGPLQTSNYSIELILDGHNINSLIAGSGKVTIKDATGKISTATGNLEIRDGNFGTVSGVGNGMISGGTFDVQPPVGSYDSTKYAVITTGGRYKVVSVTSPEYLATTTLKISQDVKVLDASNTTGISTTDASLATIWNDVKSVLEAFVADGSTLAVNGAVGELITSAPYSMTAENIRNTLKSGSSTVSIVLRKEDLKMANAGFDYQHIKAKLTPGYSVAALYDISIICYFNGTTPFMKLTRTTSDIDINLGIHNSLRAAGRRYDIIGVHNDNYGSYYYDQNYFFAQGMNAGTTSYHTINFKTNFFSTYALVAQGGNFNVPVTADSNNTTLWVTLLCVSGMCGACAIYLRRRKAKVY